MKIKNIFYMVLFIMIIIFSFMTVTKALSEGGYSFSCEISSAGIDAESLLQKITVKVRPPDAPSDGSEDVPVFSYAVPYSVDYIDGFIKKDEIWSVWNYDFIPWDSSRFPTKQEIMTWINSAGIDSGLNIEYSTGGNTTVDTGGTEDLNIGNTGIILP